MWSRWPGQRGAPPPLGAPQAHRRARGGETWRARLRRLAARGGTHARRNGRGGQQLGFSLYSIMTWHACLVACKRAMLELERPCRVAVSSRCGVAHPRVPESSRPSRDVASCRARAASSGPTRAARPFAAPWTPSVLEAHATRNRRRREVSILELATSSRARVLLAVQPEAASHPVRVRSVSARCREVL